MPALLLAAVCLGLPRWVDDTLAGYALANDEQHGVIGVYDARRGFYLMRTSECDGAFLGLTLTRDRKIVEQNGFRLREKSEPDSIMMLKLRRLPSLRTRKGIAIGDAPALVRN